MAASQHTQSDPSKRTLEADAKPRQAYDRLVAQFVAQLEAGTAPWVKPWTCPQVAAGRQASGLPHNAATGRPYSGVNVLFLWASAQAFGYQGNGWLTYKQAAELGGHVRKGEHGTTVVYFKTLSRLATNDEGEEVERTFRLARAYTVFNVAQCEGLPEAITKVEPEVRPVAIIEDDADQFFADTGVTIRRGGDRAFCSPPLMWSPCRPGKRSRRASMTKRRWRTSFAMPPVMSAGWPGPSATARRSRESPPKSCRRDRRRVPVP